MDLAKERLHRLRNQVAVVAGAPRGAGRGIARMLGAVGATVYCNGRSVSGRPATAERPETILRRPTRRRGCGPTSIAIAEVRPRWIAGEWTTNAEKRRVKCYVLTPAGRRQLAAQRRTG